MADACGVSMPLQQLCSRSQLSIGKWLLVLPQVSKTVQLSDLPLLPQEGSWDPAPATPRIQGGGGGGLIGLLFRRKMEHLASAAACETNPGCLGHSWSNPSPGSKPLSCAERGWRPLPSCWSRRVQS